MSVDLMSETALTSYNSLEVARLEAISSPPNHAVNNKYPLISKYKIISRQASESAWIFFVEDTIFSKSLVMKVLRPYSDSRYNLSDVAERQQCQREALRQNRIFTPEVYIGLVRLYNRPIAEDHILIGEIIQNPDDAKFEPGAEYALIMERLPDERRLDQLLAGPYDEVQELLTTLTRYISSLHTDTRRLPSLPEDESVDRGSFASLQSKLDENIAFLELLLDRTNSSTIVTTVEKLVSGLREVFTEEHYGEYLKQRVQSGYIKHCHGDIKALNIWILPNTHEDHLEHFPVKLLDAIDFNPLFCNIDILSDFAMLVVDVQARTLSSELVENMIKTYLRCTDQDNKVARSLLEFYVTEKAIIAATINILFDNQFGLGQRLLELALSNLRHLQDDASLLALSTSIN